MKEIWYGRFEYLINNGTKTKPVYISREVETTFTLGEEQITIDRIAFRDNKFVKNIKIEPIKLLGYKPCDEKETQEKPDERSKKSEEK